MLPRLLCALIVSHTVLSAASSILSLVGTPTLNPGTDQVELFFKADPLPDALRAKPLKIEDTTRGSPVRFIPTGSAEYEGGSGQSAYWRSTWKIANFTPGTTESRTLLLRLGDVTEMLSITLSERMSPEMQTSLAGPATPLQLRYGRDAYLRLTIRGSLSGVRLAQASLVEEKTGRSLTLDQLDLIRDGTPADVNGLLLNRPIEPLVLRVKPGFDAPGKFVGTVSLGSREKPDLGSFQMTVLSTACRYAVAGIVFVILGLALYFVVAIWAKARGRKLLALLPAARLRDESTRLIREIEDARQMTGFAFPVLLALNPANPSSLRRFLDQLSEQHLITQGYLPFRFVFPFASQDLSAPYQTFLLTTGNQVANAGLIVRWGIASVVELWPQVTAQSICAAGIAALTTLDNLGQYVGPPDQLRSQILTALQTLQTALAGAAGGGAAVPTGRAGVPGSQQITVELEILSAWVWAAWGVLTILIGATVLVLFNGSFGTPQDMMQCFLWGAGMPAVAQGFGGLSASSVSSAFSLQIPR